MRKVHINQLSLVALSVLLLAVVLGAAETEKSHLRAKLDGIHETNPSTIIPNATGTLVATVNDDSTITYTLTYKNLSTPITQAHIHIGATKITGGVSIFFCTNLGNRPPAPPLSPTHATHSPPVTHPAP